MIDFADTWNSAIKHNKSSRHLEEIDLAFWQDKAEQNAKWSRRTPETLKRLQDHLDATMSLLEVGAGTGRFALQLAPFVKQVTALDYSHGMLKELKAKQELLGLVNVRTKLGNMNRVKLQAHDTVLAAWSLYSSSDILPTLSRLIDLSQKQLIILDDDSSGSPHRQLRHKLWEARPTPMPKYLVLTGALWQLGFRASIEIIRETTEMTFASKAALIHKFCPEGLNEAKRKAFFEGLSPFLNSLPEGLTYTYPFEIAMIHWQRKTPELRTHL